MLAFLEKILFAPRFRSVFDVCAYYLLPIVLAFVVIDAQHTHVFAQFGSAAMALLIALLFLKPIAMITQMRLLQRLLIYRRQVGVAMMWLALFHTIGLIHPEKIVDVANYSMDNFVLYGAIAMVGTLLLGITSNDYSMRLLKGNWKKLHYAAYPILLLTLIHAGMASGEMMKIFVITGMFLILKTLEWNKFTLSLNKS
jgi:DMSO/TMAO reductase YedYZ heme-binding membrane subunit